MMARQCEAHLDAGGIGRVVLVTDRGPVAHPLNFVVSEGDVIVSTRHATGTSRGKKKVECIAVTTQSRSSLTRSLGERAPPATTIVAMTGTALPGGLSQPASLPVASDAARDGVRQHRHDLGAIVVGDGPRPRILFDPDQAAKSLTSRSVGERSQKPQSPVKSGQTANGRSIRSGRDVELLPFPGSEQTTKHV